MAKRTAPDGSAAAILTALEALAAEQGAVIDLPAAEDLAPGAIVHVRAHSPRSVEGFVLAARAQLPVYRVQALSTGIDLEIRVPEAGE